jgi:hypothetical protein
MRKNGEAPEGTVSRFLVYRFVECTRRGSRLDLARVVSVVEIHVMSHARDAVPLGDQGWAARAEQCHTILGHIRSLI